MNKQVRKAYDRETVIDVIERRNFECSPIFIMKAWGNGTYEKYGKELDEIASRFPDDICACWYTVPGTTHSTLSNPEYRWGYKESYDEAETHSISEATVLLDDWKDLDKFLDVFPDPYEEGNFIPVENAVSTAGNRYKLGCFWNGFHERFWMIRGMENLMYDYYDNMPELKRMGNQLLAYFKVIIERYAKLGFDGIFTSDDLGHQSGPMMNPAIFRELFLPLYKELIGLVHSKGMHFWFHSCGDNSMLMPDLIEAGIDVFHPVQKGCMDLEKTIDDFGDQISFMYGIDVQHLLPEGSVADVQNEINMIKTLFRSKKAGLLLSAANGIMPDTPIENIKAMLETSYSESYIL